MSEVERILLEEYEVPLEAQARYIRFALEHRNRCSMWLAEIDVELGFEGSLTQTGNEPGEEAQKTRLQAIRARHK